MRYLNNSEKRKNPASIYRDLNAQLRKCNVQEHKYKRNHFAKNTKYQPTTR